MDYIKLAKELLNNNKHESTGFTPVELMCGWWGEGIFKEWVKFSPVMTLNRKELIKARKQL